LASPVSGAAERALHRIEAEEALIGALLIDPSHLPDAAGLVESADFHRDSHRWLWEALLVLQGRGEAVDLVSLMGALEEAGRLAEIGGLAGLSILVSRTPDSQHVLTYAAQVASAAARRRLLSAAQTIGRLAHRWDLQLEAVREAAWEALASTSRQPAARLPVQFRELIRDLDGPGKLSPHLLGLLPGELLAISGPAGGGKTALLLEIISHAAAVSSRPVLCFSLALSARRLAVQLAARRPGGEPRRRTDEGLACSAGHLADAPLMLVDAPGASGEQLCEEAAHLASRPALVGVAGLPGERAQDWLALQNLARRLDIPVVVAASGPVAGPSDVQVSLPAAGPRDSAVSWLQA
jgi:replicative DNA helicase